MRVGREVAEIPLGFPPSRNDGGGAGIQAYPDKPSIFWSSAHARLAAKTQNGSPRSRRMTSRYTAKLRSPPSFPPPLRHPRRRESSHIPPSQHIRSSEHARTSAKKPKNGFPAFARMERVLLGRNQQALHQFPATHTVIPQNAGESIFTWF